MRLLFLLIFFIPLFGCNTSSNTKAYQTYTEAKHNYIQSILDNNRIKKIESLKTIVQCGKFLGFDISKYNKQLIQLTKQKKINKHSPLKIESNYIKIISYNPLKIKLSSKMRVKFLTLHSHNRYYKIFDIEHSKINRSFTKKIGENLFLKVAQNTKTKVRVVVYKKNKKFKIRYSTKNGYLTVTFLNQKPLTKYFKPKKIEYKAIKTSKRVIVIDPGHGGKDPGGIGWHRIKEKNIVLPIGKYLRDVLRKKGYKVYLTRDRDKFITLRNRTKFANRKKADLFISIHCNIAPKHPEVYGIETYFLSPARSKRAERVAKLENSAIGNLKTSTQKIVLNFLNKTKIIQSQKMAIDIQKNLIYGFRKHYKNIKDGGVRPAPFWVLVGTQMPAILIETGFISNKMEAKRLSNKIYQKRYAQYIANGIESYFLKNR